MDYGPEEEFESYADCIENEYDKMFRPIFGCKVPWLSDPNKGGLCEGVIPISSENRTFFHQSVDRVMYLEPFRTFEKFPACLKPCTEIKIHCKKTNEGNLDGFCEDGWITGLSELGIYFVNSVKVTKHFMAYGIFDLIVGVGSSLGLWIGLSALGVFDLLMDIASAVFKKTFLKTTSTGVKALRCIFQVFVFSIFAFQMYQAVEKYISFDTIFTTNIADLKDAKIPDIFLCENNQLKFKNTLNGSQGYDGLSAFLNAVVDTTEDTVSWGGSYNRTYDDLIQYLYNDSYYPGEGLYEGQYTSTFTVFNGFCKKLNISADIQAHVSEFSAQVFGEFEIFLTDPGTSNYYAINAEAFNGDKIANEFDTLKRKKYYSIQLEKIHWNKEASLCMDYGNGETFETYADCIENEHDKIFSPILGCRVPWLSGPDRTGLCTGINPISSENKTLFAQNVDKIIKYDSYQAYIQFAACPRPCTEVRITSEETKEEVLTASEYDILSLHFNQNVVVTNHIIAYGIFDLIVEIGSSLGLWIGLSALGLFDLLLEPDAVSFVEEKFLIIYNG